MRTSLITLSVLVLSLAGLGGLSGCESQRTIDELTTANRKLHERVVELQAEVNELTERLRLLQASGEDVSAEVADLTAQRDALQAEIDRLTAANQSLKAENASLRAQGTRIPVEVENALKQFADRHPDLAVYDPVTQAVKFSSDLTFAPGSANLSDGAKQAIGQLATVLNSPAASDYEVRIVGHTDSVPISRPSTRQNHPTNWHLSVHRAISVRDAIAAAGVADLRTSVSGYSMYRPVTQNTRSGAQANRRVEIYLAPMGSVDSSLIERQGSDSSNSGGSGGSAPAGNDSPAMFK